MAKMFGPKLVLTLVCAIGCVGMFSNALHLHEIHVKTSDCSDCGMAGFFGQLSAKVTP